MGILSRIQTEITNLMWMPESAAEDPREICGHLAIRIRGVSGVLSNFAVHLENFSQQELVQVSRRGASSSAQAGTNSPPSPLPPRRANPREVPVLMSYSELPSPDATIAQVKAKLSQSIAKLDEALRTNKSNPLEESEIALQKAQATLFIVLQSIMQIYIYKENLDAAKESLEQVKNYFDQSELGLFCVQIAELELKKTVEDTSLTNPERLHIVTQVVLNYQHNMQVQRLAQQTLMQLGTRGDTEAEGLGKMVQILTTFRERVSHRSSPSQTCNRSKSVF